jgi:DNA-binding NtrC family response regulator
MLSTVQKSAELPALLSAVASRDSAREGARDPRAKVLLVDDEPHVLASATLALRGLPCEVRTVTSASSALALLGREPCDIVVADECMPGMRGTELLAIIARDYPAAARIMLTGHPSVPAALRAINDAGVVRFLLKPCPPQGLRDAISVALATRTGRRHPKLPSSKAALVVRTGTTGVPSSPGVLASEQFVPYARTVLPLREVCSPMNI